MPSAKLRRLVGMQAGMDAMGDTLQMLGEIERAGRRIDRIAVDHHQRVDRAGRHVGAKRAERLRVVDCGRDRLAVPDGGAGILQLLVDRRRERLPLRIELRPDGQQRAPGMGAQARPRRGRPISFPARCSSGMVRPATENCAPIACARTASREASQGRRVDATVPVRLGTHFGDMKACAALARRALAAPFGPGRGVRHLMRPGAEQIVAEADDHVASVEPIMRRRPRGRTRSVIACVLAGRSDRLEPVPAHLGILLRQLRHLPDQRGRRRGAGENAQALALPFAPARCEATGVRR